MPHTLIIDGLQVTEVSDQAKAAIEKLQGQVRSADEARAKAEADVAKLTTTRPPLDAKITTLEQQVKDAKLTPQQLRDAAKVYVKTIDTAKKLAPTLTIDRRRRGSDPQGGRRPPSSATRPRTGATSKSPCPSTRSQLRHPLPTSIRFAMRFRAAS
jgi:hypothetical protein